MSRKNVLNVFIAFLVFQIIVLAPTGIRDLIRWENRVLGGSYFTGFLMILIAVFTIIINRHEFRFMGVSIEKLRISINMGFKGWIYLLIPQILLIFLSLMGFRIQNHLNISLLLGFLILCIGWLYSRRAGLSPAGNLKIVLIFIIFISPLIIGYLYGEFSLSLIKQFVWEVIVGGYVEEFFFRGFIQSSINLEYGNNWRFGETKLGPGLILSAAFYGLSRGLRTFKPWLGIYRISWSLTIYTFAIGIFFGLIREKSGDIMSSGTTSSMINVISNLFVRVIS